MKNTKKTKGTKKTKDKDEDQKSSPWLGNEQKIVLSNVFVGYIVAGGLTLLNYLFGKSDINGAEAFFVALGTINAVVFILVLRKE